jgi:hypothetical protein
MQKAVLLFVAVSSLLSLHSEASDWSRVNLRSQGNYQIQINFRTTLETQPDGKHVTRAAPVWINVVRPGNLGRVDAVLLNFVYDKNDPTERTISMQTYHIELDGRMNGRSTSYGGFIPDGTSSFAGELKGGKGLVIGSDRYGYRQEIAFHDEYGEWQIDPVSRSHNFKFNMMKALQRPRY